MKPSIFKWERRDYRKKEIDWNYFLLPVTILFISSLVFFITTVFHLTDVAKASDINPSAIHSMQGACQYAKENPNKIVNVKELLSECSKLK